MTELQARSRRLSWLLRHGAREVGLPMDAAGWVRIDDVLTREGLDRPTLEQIVARNDKGRLEVDGDRVRACQGHSLEGAPVTREALEASWTPVGPRDLETAWHGTQLAALDAIAATGLQPQRRTHVHLAERLDSRVGKRAQVQVVLAVSVETMALEGLGLWRSPNGVILARRVPRAHIVGAVPIGRTARGRAERGEGPFKWVQPK